MTFDRMYTSFKSVQRRVVLGLTAACTATAVSAFTAADFDYDQSKSLEQHEVEQLLAHAAAVSVQLDPRKGGHFTEAIPLLRETDYPGATPIPLTAIPPYKPQSKPCNTRRADFVLRRDVTTSNLLDCQAAFFGSANGALFSLTRDGVSDTTRVSLDGGIAYAFKPRFFAADATGANKLRLSERAFGLFLQANGGRTTSDEVTGVVRGGLIGQWRFEGGGIEGLLVSGSAYHQTDLEAKSKGYGVSLSATVRALDFGLGGLPAEKCKDVCSYLLPTLGVDAFRVSDAGQTGLEADESYTFVTSRFELVHRNANVGPHGADFRLILDHAVGLGDSSTSTLGKATASLFLDEDKKASFAVTYDKGRDYRSLQDVDRLTVSFGLTF